MRRDGIRQVDTRADTAGRELTAAAAPTALPEGISQSPAGDGGASLSFESPRRSYDELSRPFERASLLAGYGL